MATRKQRKQIEKARKKASGKKGNEMSAQESIPFRRMDRDGFCKLRNGTYSMSAQFRDLNFQMCKAEEQKRILNEWGQFLNSFDESTWIQFSYVNIRKILYNSTNDTASSFGTYMGDTNDVLYQEVTEMQTRMRKKADTGRLISRYVTFGTKGENAEDAKTRLKALQSASVNNLRQIGSDAKPMDGEERLELMHDILHAGQPKPFNFKWDSLAGSGLSPKDCIAPSSFEFAKGSTFKIGECVGAVSYVKILASDISDRLLSGLLNINTDMVVTIHIQPINRIEALKRIRHTITDLDRMKVNEQMKAARAGYDMDILPVELESYGVGAKDLLDKLQKNNERYFDTTILVMNICPDEERLKRGIKRVEAFFQQANCQLTRLDYRQEEGLMSSLPLGLNAIKINRNLTTSSAAAFIPFTTKELISRSNEGLYFGDNSLSGMPIIIDRKRQRNTCGMIFGTSGSGKSFSAKQEILFTYYYTDDDIIIADPETEYSALTKRLKGQIVHLSAQSKDYVNPLDISQFYSYQDVEPGVEADVDPLSFKMEFILSLCELIIKRPDEFWSVGKTVVDKCTHAIYRQYLADPKPENMPILEDLYNELLKQPETEAQELAKAMEIYVKGSFNVFNHRTNVDMNNRLICFDIRNLGNQLKPLGMLIVQDAVWNRVTENRSMKKWTRYYIDEMHLLLKTPQTASYIVEIWKRFRKWGGIPTGLTQNIKDMYRNKDDVANIIENSDYVCMLGQRGEDLEILKKQLRLSPDQEVRLQESKIGEGLLFLGGVIVPFRNAFPHDTEMYRAMSTKLSESRDE